ncbi:MAG: periplasmic heavy metal sensor [Gammaproteobacteria bacterium]|nr:periplasmic heavy metal sensor [Gammaproteobacteria bacterium]
MRSKWLVVVLVVSLALNVAAIGFGIGLATGSPTWGRGFDPTAGLSRLVRSLPEDRRAELTRAGTPAMSDGELRRRIGTSLRHLRASQHAIAKAVAQEPFDPDAVRAALADFREHLAANQTSSHQAFVEILGRLTPDERSRFLETMRPGKDRRPRHGTRPRPDGTPRIDNGP